MNENDLFAITGGVAAGQVQEYVLTRFFDGGTTDTSEFRWGHMLNVVFGLLAAGYPAMNTLKSGTVSNPIADEVLFAMGVSAITRSLTGDLLP